MPCLQQCLFQSMRIFQTSLISMSTSVYGYATLLMLTRLDTPCLKGLQRTQHCICVGNKMDANTGTIKWILCKGVSCFVPERWDFPVGWQSHFHAPHRICCGETPFSMRAPDQLLILNNIYFIPLSFCFLHFTFCSFLSVYRLPSHGLVDALHTACRTTLRIKGVK